jgi:hypothetical protein
MSLEWSTLDNCFNSPLTGDSGAFEHGSETGGDTSKPWLDFNQHQNSYRDDVFSPFFEKSPESTQIPTAKDDLVPRPAQTASTVVRQTTQDAPTLSPGNDGKKSSEDILKALNLNSSNPHQATLPGLSASPNNSSHNSNVGPEQVKPLSLFPVPEGEKKKSTSLRDMMGGASPGNMGDRPLATRATFPNHPNNNYQVHLDQATNKVVPNTLSTIPKLRMTKEDLLGKKPGTQQKTEPYTSTDIMENFQSPFPSNDVDVGPLNEQENQDKIWLVVLVIYIGMVGLMVGNNMRR